MMLPQGVAMARSHLERARGAFNSIGGLMEGPVPEIWSSYLIAGKAIYEALRKGAKDDPTSRQWLAGKRAERRLDPLLNYLFRARNAAEHGLHPVLVPGGKIRGSAAIQGVTEFETRFTPEGYFAVGFWPDGHRREVQFTPPDFRLTRVYDDRSDAWCEVPTSHCGSMLESTTPMAVGRLWLSYLEAMVNEAETFVVLPA